MPITFKKRITERHTLAEWRERQAAADRVEVKGWANRGKYKNLGLYVTLYFGLASEHWFIGIEKGPNGEVLGPMFCEWTGE